MRVAAFWLLWLLAPVCIGAGAEPSREGRSADSGPNLSLNVYGLSYHTDREGSRRNHVDNELNVGLGLTYELHNDERGVRFFEAGSYKDSGRNWAKFAGPGYQVKLDQRWRLGAALFVVDSRTYNNGRIFVAPIPLLTYDLGAAKVNAIYAPRMQGSHFSVFGLYLSIPLAQ